MVRKLVEKPQVDVNTLISKGAPVKQDILSEQKTKNKHAHLNFRIPVQMLEKVDQALNDRVGISRNGWILEAIQEKLRSDSQG